LAFTLLVAGRSNPARTAMMEMVTSSSISVNPVPQKLDDHRSVMEQREAPPFPSDGGELKFERHWPVPFRRIPTAPPLGELRGGFLVLMISRDA